MRRGGAILVLSSVLAMYAGAWVSPGSAINALFIVIPGELLFLAGWIVEGFCL
jgi:hypothetical protein